MSHLKPRPGDAQDFSSPTRTMTGEFSQLAQTLPAWLLAKGLAKLRPFGPQLVPLAIFLLLLPLLTFLAIAAGWVVWRAAAVNWNVDVHLQYGDGIPPYALVNLPPLVPKQAYDISLHLVIPVCESNLALGNFMTSLTLSTLTNDTITMVRRPTFALPPRSSSWAFLSGQSNVVAFDVALLKSYAPTVSDMLAYIQLGRQDRWKSLGRGEGREVSVLAASLAGTVKHQGVRGVVTRFPLFVALVSAVAFFSVTCTILAACFLPTIVKRSGEELVRTESPTTPITPPEPVEKRQPGPSFEDIVPPRRIKRSRRSRSRSTDDGFVLKTEVPDTVIPPGPLQSTPLRRRRSRASDGES